MPLYSQAKKPFFQTSAQPSPPLCLAAPFSKVKDSPVGVGVGGLGVLEEVAQVEEVLLGRGALRESDLLPLGDEVGDVHRAYPIMAS